MQLDMQLFMQACMPAPAPAQLVWHDGVQVGRQVVVHDSLVRKMAPSETDVSRPLGSRPSVNSRCVDSVPFGSISCVLSSPTGKFVMGFTVRSGTNFTVRVTLSLGLYLTLVTVR
jgi:hypothetical protein